MLRIPYFAQMQTYYYTDSLCGQIDLEMQAETCGLEPPPCVLLLDIPCFDPKTLLGKKSLLEAVTTCM